MMKFDFRRHRRAAAFSYTPGSASGTATFSRGGVANFLSLISDVIFAYLAGSDTSSATFTRAGTANFNQSV